MERWASYQNLVSVFGNVDSAFHKYGTYFTFSHFRIGEILPSKVHSVGHLYLLDRKRHANQGSITEFK